ncbi:unnamed protein product [Choristocarpus tenellus]
MRLESILQVLQGVVGDERSESETGEGGDNTLNDLGDKDGNKLICQCIVLPLQQSVSDLSQFQSLCEEVIDLEHLSETGGKEVRVRPSFHEELNRLGNEISRTQKSMEDVLRAVQEESKAPAGKVKLEYNVVHNYHLRVTKKDQGLVGACKGALTLSIQKAGVLFTTDALRSLGTRATHLKAQYQDVQGKIVDQAVTVASTYATVLLSAAKVVSELDVLVALSICAQTWDWCRPKVLQLGHEVLDFKDLRHPCVEEARGSSKFIPNDINITHTNKLAIVTGPNCGGKSTFIRSVGIACLLAQIGSFVPASKATVSVMNRICARVGASDNQLRGVSTFMAEMLETVAILRRVSR